MSVGGEGWLAEGLSFLQRFPLRGTIRLASTCSAGALVGSGREAQQEAVCTTLANYAQDCAKRHIHLRWRQPGFCGRTPTYLCASPHRTEVGIE